MENIMEIETEMELENMMEYGNGVRNGIWKT